MSDHDRKFFDNFALILGALVLVTIVLVVIARNMSEETQEQWTKDDPHAQAAIDERLKPAGYVVKTGDAEPVAAPVVAAVADEPAPARSGAEVYNTVCAACHSTGAAGAPKVGNAAVWSERLGKGLDMLVQNAVKGFQGSAGYMPPKGGRMDLSDEDVAAAVDHMLEQSK